VLSEANAQCPWSILGGCKCKMRIEEEVDGEHDLNCCEARYG
jgi:hypothetical protein